MKIRVSRWAATVAGALLLVPWLTGSPEADSRPEDRLLELRKKIHKEERIVEEIQSSKSSLLDSLQAMDQKIARTRERLRNSRKQSRELGWQIQHLREELKGLEAQVRRRSLEAGQRLDAFYRLGRDGLLPVLFSESTLPRKFRDLDALRRVLDTDWMKIRSFHELLAEKELMETGLEARLAEEKELQGQVKNQEKELVAKRRDKDNLLFRLEKDEKLHRQLLEEMNQSAHKLEALLKKAAEEPEPPAPRVGTGGVPGGAFASRKGRLPWPVKGDLFRKFGTYSEPSVKARVRNRGIDIRARQDEPVRAVWGGSVLYADWFRGYGNLLIVDHGKKHFSVHSHLSRLSKGKGEPVEAGEVVGYAGDTGSLEGILVHFEIWRAGTPQNPLHWIRKKR